MYFKKNVMFNVAECNLGKGKLEPMLSAAFSGGHAQGFAFTGFVAGVFGLHFSYVCSLFACLACHR